MSAERNVIPMTGENGKMDPARADAALTELALTVPALRESVGQLGQYIMQLGQIVGAMQRRISELEDQQAQVTVSHEDVKGINGMIRMRTEQICERYELRSPESARAVRAAIKRDVLARWHAKDLHDLPRSALGGIGTMIGSWSSMRKVLELREKAEGGRSV